MPRYLTPIVLEGIESRVSRAQCYEILSQDFAAGPTSNGGAGTGPSGLSLGSIEIPAAGTYDVTHTAIGLMNNAGFGISSSPLANAANTVAAADIFNTQPGGDRLTVASPSRTYSVPFPAAGTYYIGVFSGGGGSATTHTVTVDGVVVAGDIEAQKVNVFTLEDGSQYAFLDDDNTEIDISGGIPSGWQECEVDEPEEPVTTHIFDGIPVDAAPAWEGSLILADNQSGSIQTGVDLTKVDVIKISFRRHVNANGAKLWPSPLNPVRIKDIELGVTQGALLEHFSNQFLAIENMTEALLGSG